MQIAVNTEQSDLENILDNLDAVVYVADIETHELLYMNQYALTHIGKVDSFAAVKGKRCYQVLQRDQQSPCDFCTNALLPKNGDTYLWEFKNTRNGCWYQCRDRLIRWHDGRLVRLEVATDISVRKQMEVELEQARDELKILAEQDSLTKLFNRHAFFLYAENLRKSLPVDALLGLMILDLDYFKDINDNYGHEAGDELLAAIGRELKGLADDKTVISRMGGEEFAIVFRLNQPQQAERFARQVYKLVSEVRAVYFSDILRCTTSIGVTCGHANTPLKQLMRVADDALYEAKAAGRSQIKMV